MRRKGQVIRGGFGQVCRRAHGLPPELTSLLDVDRKKRKRRRFLWYWGGAAAVGMAIGIGPGLLRSAQPLPGQFQALTGHAAAYDEKPTLEDEQWASGTNIDRTPPAGVTATFGFCHSGGGTNCVVDGDTIWIRGQKVRVADIDAPETHDFRCPEEKALGDRATQRLIQLMNSGPITMKAVDRDEDIYGRKLRIVMVGGTSVGDTLVGEGLARFYDGGRKPWC